VSIFSTAGRGVPSAAGLLSALFGGGAQVGVAAFSFDTAIGTLQTASWPS
jgi:hypothetical protein